MSSRRRAARSTSLVRRRFVKLSGAKLSLSTAKVYARLIHCRGRKAGSAFLSTSILPVLTAEYLVARWIVQEGSSADASPASHPLQAQSSCSVCRIPPTPPHWGLQRNQSCH